MQQLSHSQPNNLHFYDLHPSVADFKQAVLNGLTEQPKTLSPKFFYDEQGSKLFEAIMDLPEYYPTRTEIEILRRNGEAISGAMGENNLLIELGSGNSVKIRTLLDAVQPAAYMPLDISKEHLYQQSYALANDYPALSVHATCADYSDDFELPYCPTEMTRTAFFPGSSIGNFTPTEALALLHRVVRLLGVGGKLLIGVDLKKDQHRLHAAYNDTQGVTAAFNLNLLQRINRELDGEFDVNHFRHTAFYNPEVGRIEMHLISEEAQQVRIDGHAFVFAQGESIHTENSYKYSIEQFHALAAQAGLVAEQVWVDDQQLFSVHCLRVE